MRGAEADEVHTSEGRTSWADRFQDHRVTPALGDGSGGCVNPRSRLLGWFLGPDLGERHGGHAPLKGGARYHRGKPAEDEKPTGATGMKQGQKGIRAE